MINPDDLFISAIGIGHRDNSTEADVRRAISGIYYYIFHLLASAGANHFNNGGQSLTSQVSRCFVHSDMRKSCDKYCKNNVSAADITNPTTPSAKLVAVAQAFLSLQEARQKADYDLTVTYTQQDGKLYLAEAARAARLFNEVRGLPETTAFLAALLFGDRLTRR